ncbi:MAG: DUF2846 domain-containing protein [Nitrospirales bacterium]|nr:DUF2846 domain-containing protein [Nitrospirales bacterium]
MKTLLKFVAVFIVSLSLWGCATSGPKYSELLPTISTAPPDTGRIYIYRTAVFGFAVQPDVTLNGEVIGQAVPHGFFYVDKKAGTYEILTSTEVDRKLSLLLESGQTRYVRLNIAMGFFVGHVYPELIDPKIAEEEIQDCHYIGAEIKAQK